jgi:predicted component of type VI protein secretion system
MRNQPSSEVIAMKLSLFVLTPGKQEGKLLPITLSQYVIGRDPQCQLRPASPMISKRHCAILTRGGKVFLRDFDSTNGCFVNGDKVEGEVELHHGDRLKIGPLEFEARIDVRAPAARPTPAPATPAAVEKTQSAKGEKTIPAPKAKKAEEPPPEKKEPARDEGGPAGEDDIAAMLLSLQDNSSSGMADDVPEGSTVLDLKVPDGVLNDTKEENPAKKDDKKDPKKEMGNTINAAKSILEKMMRRPRT